MGAGGAASRALAWASLPLLGPPAGALCEDTLCCRGKAGLAAGVPLSLPKHLLGPFYPSPSQIRSGERSLGRGAGWGGVGGAGRDCGETPGIRTGLGRRRARRSLQTHL